MSEIRSVQPDRSPSDFRDFSLDLEAKLKQQLAAIDPETLKLLMNGVNQASQQMPNAKLDAKTMAALQSLLNRMPE